MYQLANETETESETETETETETKIKVKVIEESQLIEAKILREPSYM